MPIKTLSIVLLLASSLHCQAQLSKGQGETAYLAKLNCNIYLPQHFEIMSNGTGVVHKATASIVTIVKIPAEKAAMVNKQSETVRSILVDERMNNVEFLKLDRKSTALRTSKAHAGEQIYKMKYTMQDIAFERINVIIPKDDEQYLVVANYTERYRDQVKLEIDKIIESIEFL